jgi:hypothetical protein
VLDPQLAVDDVDVRERGVDVVAPVPAHHHQQVAVALAVEDGFEAEGGLRPRALLPRAEHPHQRFPVALYGIHRTITFRVGS